MKYQYFDITGTEMYRKVGNMSKTIFFDVINKGIFLRF